MTFSIQVKDLLTKKIAKHPQAIKGGTRSAFNLAGKHMVNRAKKSMTEPKTGRLYRVRVGGRIINHKASAEGEPLANLTGKTRSSIGHIPSSNKLIVGGGEGIKYWEEGNRKTLKPAIDSKREFTRNLLKKEIIVKINKIK